MASRLVFHLLVLLQMSVYCEEISLATNVSRNQLSMELFQISSTYDKNICSMYNSVRVSDNTSTETVTCSCNGTLYSISSLRFPQCYDTNRVDKLGCIGRPIILTTNQFNLFRADEECNIENTYFVDAEVWNGRNWEKWLRNDFVYSSRNYWLYIAWFVDNVSEVYSSHYAGNLFRMTFQCNQERICALAKGIGTRQIQLNADKNSTTAVTTATAATAMSTEPSTIKTTANEASTTATILPTESTEVKTRAKGASTTPSMFKESSPIKTTANEASTTATILSTETTEVKTRAKEASTTPTMFKESSTIKTTANEASMTTTIMSTESTIIKTTKEASTASTLMKYKSTKKTTVIKTSHTEPIYPTKENSTVFSKQNKTTENEKATFDNTLPPTTISKKEHIVNEKQKVKSDEDSSNNTPLYLGVGAGIGVLLILILVILVVFKRHKDKTQHHLRKEAQK